MVRIGTVEAVDTEDSKVLEFQIRQRNDSQTSVFVSQDASNDLGII